MSEVNEEIVKAYYEAQGYLVKTNHYYVKKKFVEGEKKGQGASDIDLIVIHPKTNDKAIISVKGWQNDVVRKSNIKRWEENTKLKIDSQTIEAGISFFGDKNFRKILVLSSFEENNAEELKRELEKFYGYEEVLDFPTILVDLIEGNKLKNIPHFDEHKNYKNSEFMQTLRILIKYYIEPKK